jgi:hypothetical protein
MVAGSALQGVLEVAQPVAAALDLEDMGAVEQPVEDSRGQHLVAGEQFGPVTDALVGGDDLKAVFQDARMVRLFRASDKLATALAARWMERANYEGAARMI